MIALSPEAETHVDELIEYFEAKGRLQAATNLLSALERAKDWIAATPAAGLLAPRPYPALVRLGWRWIKVGPYWVAYVVTATGATIAGVFHEVADIPGRL